MKTIDKEKTLRKELKEIKELMRVSRQDKYLLESEADDLKLLSNIKNRDLDKAENEIEFLREIVRNLSKRSQ